MLGSSGARPPEPKIYAGRQPAYMSASGVDRSPPIKDPKASTPGASWAYWALPLLGLLGLMWYLLPGAQAPNPTAQTRTSTSASTPVRMLPSPGDASFYITKLADGWTSVGAYQRQDIFNRAGAPGNAFAFLMAGAATDYTEVMGLKERTGSWKIALFLPLVTVPQVVLIALLINGL